MENIPSVFLNVSAYKAQHSKETDKQHKKEKLTGEAH